MNIACYDDVSFPWLVLAHGQPNRTQEAANEFGIGICYRFSQDLHFIIVYTELYLTVLHCAILHYTALYNGICGHECTEFVVGLAEEAVRVTLSLIAATWANLCLPSNSFDLQPLQLISQLQE